VYSIIANLGFIPRTWGFEGWKSRTWSVQRMPGRESRVGRLHADRQWDAHRLKEMVCRTTLKMAARRWSNWVWPCGRGRPRRLGGWDSNGCMRLWIESAQQSQDSAKDGTPGNLISTLTTEEGF